MKLKGESRLARLADKSEESPLGASVTCARTETVTETISAVFLSRAKQHINDMPRCANESALDVRTEAYIGLPVLQRWRLKVRRFTSTAGRVLARASVAARLPRPARNRRTCESTTS